MLASGLKKIYLVICRIADYLPLVCTGIASVMLMAVVFLVAYGAIFRYFGKSTIGVEEIGGFAMVGIVFLPLGYVLIKGNHITVDIFVRHLSSKVRSVLFIIANLTISLFFCTALLWSSIWLIKDSHSIQSVSITLRVPIFIPQLSILIGTCVFIIALVSALIKNLVRSLDCLRKG